MDEIGVNFISQTQTNPSDRSDKSDKSDFHPQLALPGRAWEGLISKSD